LAVRVYDRCTGPPDALARVPLFAVGGDGVVSPGSVHGQHLNGPGAYLR
jgi:hypothetical protein